MLLSRVVPLEDAIRRNLAVEFGRQFGHLQVGIVGNEAATVAIAFGTQREGYHIAALQLERANLVVQLLIRQRVHKSAAVLQPEVIHGRTAEILF